MRQSKTRRLVGTALFGVCAYLLMFLEFPIVPAFPYLKVDFGDIPLLIAYFLYGPAGGIAATAIRSVLHYIQTGGDMGYPIGDVASFIASLAYCLPVYYLLRRAQSKKDTLVGLLAGTVSLTVVLSLANWLVITPLYLKILNFESGPLRELIFAGIVPFNIVKGLLLGIVFLVIEPRLKPWIVKNAVFHTGPSLTRK